MHQLNMRNVLTALLALSLPGLALSHMQMSQPYPIRSEFDPFNKASGNIDYSMTSPLLASGANFPCKGYQNDRPIHTTATYKAGSKQQLTLAGSATHGGGSCQLSLSYDNGKTFRVIKSMIGGCPLTPSYEFTIPSYAPNGTALLGWSWQNKIGNREYYMNCAEVDIISDVKLPSSNTKHRRGRHYHLAHQQQHQHSRRSSFTSFNDLPYIWQANMPDQNTCMTTEGEEPVYPHPGPDVQYGDGMSASSPVTQGDCDAATPPGQTYKDLPVSGGSNEQVSYSSAAAAAPTASSGSNSGSGTPSSPGRQGGGAAPAGSASSSAPAQAAAPSDGCSNGTGTQTSPGLLSSCTNEGQIECIRGGQGFAMCDNGGWADMGSVAAGTMCVGQGQIVAAAAASAAIAE